MFSAWDLNSWIASVGALLFIIGVLTGLGALASAFMSRVWREERDTAPAMPDASGTSKETPIHKAA
jgi:hypothetical protein